MTPNIFEYKNERHFAEDSSQAIEDFIVWKLKEQETVSVALSGGHSPKAVYQKLARNKKIDWDRVELFMVDERYVPPEDERSNFKMIEETLLSKLPPLKGFYGFNTHLDLDQAAENYDQELEKRGRKLFDLVILGLGEDGHTASLFPHTKAVQEKIKLATTSCSPDGMDRLTITFPAILSSEKIMFLIRGKSKKEMLKRILRPEKVDESEIPAKIVLRHPNVEIYFETSS